MNILKLCIGTNGRTRRAAPYSGATRTFTAGATMVCVLMLLAAGCGKNTSATAPANPKAQPPSPPPATSAPAAAAPQAATSPLDGWIKFSPRDGGFSVLLPNPPTETQTNLETRAGEFTMHAFVAARGERDAYSVTYYDFPAAMSSDPKLFLAKVEALMVVGQHGKVTYYAQKPDGNYPGTEFEFTAGGKANFSMRTRLILVGNRVYAPAVLFHTGAPLPPESTPFFDSFSLQ